MFHNDDASSAFNWAVVEKFVGKSKFHSNYQMKCVFSDDVLWNIAYLNEESVNKQTNH